MTSRSSMLAALKKLIKGQVFCLKLRVFMIVAIATVNIAGCGGSSFDSAAARARADTANIARVSLDLRRIGSTWTCYRSNHGLDEWSISQPATSRDKAVKYDSERKLIYEEDTYLSGRIVHMDGQTAEEWLSIYYDYAAKKAELHYLGTDAVIRGLVEGTLTASTPTVLSVADRILKTWGIPRL